MPKEKTKKIDVVKNPNRPQEFTMRVTRTYDPEVEEQTFTLSHLREIKAGLEKQKQNIINMTQDKIKKIDAEIDKISGFITEGQNAGVEEPI